MPELPEVETIRRTLIPLVKDAVIDKIIVHETRLRRPIKTRSLKYWLQDQKFCDITRRAKYLIFHFQNQALLVMHLGMSGSLQIAQPNDPLEKHTHLIFRLSNGRDMRFRDTRRFGIVEVIKPGHFDQYVPFQHLGVEPLSDEFSSEYLRQVVGKSTRAVKTVLMDARVVVGVGNIYASEALFLAGVHPLTPIVHLEDDQLDFLVDSVRQILNEALEQGGTTLNDFRNGTGEPGSFQVSLRVYGRKGHPCLKCDSTIERIVTVGRSTFFCPECQKMLTI